MAPIAAVGLLGILIAAPAASGQAAIDQYVPQGNPAGGTGGGTIGSSGGLQTPGAVTGHAIAAHTGKGTGSGGQLPLTDYPVTPFVWIVLALLLAGALVRVTAPMLGRRRARGAT
jgi:PPE-repeat protein